MWHENQEWRTAYVAVTRARSRLYASGAWWVGSPAPLKNPTRPSPLFELIERRATTRGSHPPAGTRPQHLRLGGVGESPDPVFQEGWRLGLLRAASDPSWPARRAAELDTFELFEHERAELEALSRGSAVREPAVAEEGIEASVTGLVTFAICPRRYSWSEVDRLPRRPSAAARRGARVHRQIELRNLGMVPFEEMSVDLYDVTVGEEPAGDPFQAFERSRFAAAKPRYVEVPFELALRNGARIRGRADAVYVDGITEVVDFKTGRPPSSPEAKTQLEAYALALVETGLATPPMRVTFAFLGGGIFEESEDVDAAWIDDARSHLEALTSAIGTGEFPATPSSSCRSCDFVRFCEQGRAWLEAAGVSP